MTEAKPMTDLVLQRLLALTPGGSEYFKGYPNSVVDAEACIAYLERQRHSKLEMAKEHKREKDSLRAERDAAVEKLGVVAAAAQAVVDTSKKHPGQRRLEMGPALIALQFALVSAFLPAADKENG